MFEEQKHSSSHIDLVLPQASTLEKEFIEIHEKPSEDGTKYYLKNITQVLDIRDVSEIAYYLDKGKELSEMLNRKLNYTTGIRYTQVFTMYVQSEHSEKPSTFVFVDLPDYDKLQTNIIDN